MDYKEKYEEALEKARQLCAYPTTKPFISDLQDLFPELAENEDEKIRKAIARVFNEHKPEEHFYGVACFKILAWLEKQEKPVEWNKADDVMFKELYDFLTYNKTVLQRDCNLYAHWLKSLKDRIGG